MSDQLFQIILWYIVALSHFATAFAFWKWATFLKPNGKIIWGIAGAYLVQSLWGFATTTFALIRVNEGFNDLYESIGWLARTRSVSGVLFTVGVAVATNLAARKAYHLTPIQKETLRGAMRSFVKLENVLTKN